MPTCAGKCRIVRGPFVGDTAPEPDLWDFCGDAAVQDPSASEAVEQACRDWMPMTRSSAHSLYGLPRTPGRYPGERLVHRPGSANSGQLAVREQAGAGHARVPGLVSLRCRPGGRRRAGLIREWPSPGRTPAAVLSWLNPRALSEFPSVLFPGGSPGCSAALVCQSVLPVRRGAGRTPHGHGRAPGQAGGRGYQP